MGAVVWVFELGVLLNLRTPNYCTQSLSTQSCL